MGKQSRRLRARPATGHPGLTVATANQVRRAFERFDSSAGWESIAPSIVPLLPRHTPSPMRAGAPIQAYLPPGIPVTFGIDLGPAFVAVTRELVDRWGVDPGTVARRALDNVRALAAELPPAIVEEIPLDDGRAVKVLRSRAGWASGLLLVPDLLPRFFGPGPHVIGAPCRDIVMAFTVSTPLDLVADLVETFSFADPAGIAVGGFRHQAGTLEPAPFSRLQVLVDPLPRARPPRPTPLS